jgi:hypothetical protein
MDIQRKMVCELADHAAGGISRVVLKSNGKYFCEEVSMFNWLLDGSEHFKPGASYGIAVWLISDPTA